MKKRHISGAIALISIIGIGAFFNQSHQSATSTKDKFVLFGNVDFSDSGDYDETEDVDVDNDEDNDDGKWFENFIKNNKTPFSKTIKK